MGTLCSCIQKILIKIQTTFPLIIIQSSYMTLYGPHINILLIFFCTLDEWILFGLFQMIEGEFSPSLFFKVAGYGLVASLFAIYYIAIDLGHEPHIPKTYISQCAGHYPQFIIFRISTISGSALIVLGWLVNHFFLKSTAREKVFRIQKYRPEVSLILGMMGAMCLMGSTANIDTGKRNPSWHQRCAAAFFLLTSLAIFYNTFISWVAYSKIKAITSTSMLTKAVLTVLMVIQMGISWKYGSSLMDEEGIRSDIGNIIEWTYSFSIAFMMISMGEDTKDFKFVFQYVSKEEKE